MKQHFEDFFKHVRVFRIEDNYVKVAGYIIPAGEGSIHLEEAAMCFLGISTATVNAAYNAWAKQNGRPEFWLDENNVTQSDIDFIFALLGTNKNPDIETGPLDDGMPDIVAHLLVISQLFTEKELDALMWQADAMAQKDENEANPNLH